MSNKTIANLFIYSSVIILGVFIICICVDGYTFWGHSDIRFDVTGQVGDFIGGVIGTIISAAGFYFLYLTFNDQRKSFERERLESKFFDLIKLHRENVAEMKFDGTKLKEDEDSLFIENTIYEGKSVFKVIFNQFVICKNELNPFFKKLKMFKPEYEEELLKNPFVVKNNINITLLAIVDICYSIVFYGLSSEGLLILEEMFKKKYKEKFVNDLLRFISLKPANDSDILEKWKVISNRNTRGKRNELVELIYNWRKTKNVPEGAEFVEIANGYHNRYIKYYGGHQFRLGHYYRHLYQTVKFINSTATISYKEKYEYLKTLRAQLSTYEQAVLFLNSLSKMGETWEVSPEINQDLKDFNRQDFELITKYNLIKNLPGESIYGIHFKDFYPNIEYESDGKRKQRQTYK
ncbi:MAG: putative phage abortive infection protein [Bacteroidetes bacterium]|nr:putative phage abortive infection protein [Bacteroidota bacterium]